MSMYGLFWVNVNKYCAFKNSHAVGKMDLEMLFIVLEHCVGAPFVPV